MALAGRAHIPGTEIRRARLLIPSEIVNLDCERVDGGPLACVSPMDGP
jgi:hypothetical protein